MSIELKPCPFCGGKPHFVELTEHDGENNWGGHVIACTKCGCASRIYFGEWHDQLTEAWNRRTTNNEGQQ